MELVELKPLQPFAGAYPCAMADADFVEDRFSDKDGIATKRPVPYKRYHGRVAVERRMTQIEIEQHRAGQLPSDLEIIRDGVGLWIIERPVEATVKVPADVADSLITRGLAEPVETKARKAPAKT